MKSSLILEYVKHVRASEKSFWARYVAIGDVACPNKNYTAVFYLKSVFKFFVGILDLFRLILVLQFNLEKSKLALFYVTKNMCIEGMDGLEEKLLKRVLDDYKNVIFINYGKDYLLFRINGKRVYNIGCIAKVLRRIVCERTEGEGFFRSFKIINNVILMFSPNGIKVFSPCFYSDNGLSLSFSNYRNKINLIEVQHGSILNYPPYLITPPIKMADEFYVWNQVTVDFIRCNFCNLSADKFTIVPYSITTTGISKKLNVLYASSIETKGFHPVFKSFLEKYEYGDLQVLIRLHPREKKNTEIFMGEISKYKHAFKFSNAANWHDECFPDNLIVISPWSSVLEEAYHLGLTVITIDPVGQSRFNSLIDSHKFFFSDDLLATIKKMRHS